MEEAADVGFGRRTQTGVSNWTRTLVEADDWWLCGCVGNWVRSGRPQVFCPLTPSDLSPLSLHSRSSLLHVPSSSAALHHRLLKMLAQSSCHHGQ